MKIKLEESIKIEIAYVQKMLKDPACRRRFTLTFQAGDMLNLRSPDEPWAWLLSIQIALCKKNVPVQPFNLN